MVKKVAAVDFDDTINNFNQAFLYYNQRLWGSRLEFHDLKDYNLAKTYGVTEEEMGRRVFDFCHRYHNEIAVDDAVVNGLVKLSESYDLHIVTSRCESLSETTQRLVDARLSNIFSHIHYGNGFATKHPERKRSKLQICQEIGAILLIDDVIGHVTSVHEAGIDAILFDKPWNKEVIPETIARVANWDEALEACLRL